MAVCKGKETLSLHVREHRARTGEEALSGRLAEETVFGAAFVISCPSVLEPIRSALDCGTGSLYRRVSESL